MVVQRFILGFLLIGIAVSQDCPSNKVLTAASGNISTPLYPANYPANLSCSWTIQAPAGNHIKLHFKDMNIEDCGYTCTCDKMELAIGKTSTQRRSTICQNKITKSDENEYDYSKPIYSVFNNIWLSFESDNSPSNNYKGFFATYEQIDHNPPDCPSDPVVYTGNKGSISSPNYPNKYPDLRTCYWMISVSDGPRVKLNFTVFTLQETGCRSSLEGKCTCDSVEVYDGETNATLAELCGSNLPSPVISRSKKMLVKFHSNSLEGFKGFHAEYMSTNEEAPTAIASSSSTAERTATTHSESATTTTHSESATAKTDSLSAGLLAVVLTMLMMFVNHQ